MRHRTRYHLDSSTLAHGSHLKIRPKLRKKTYFPKPFLTLHNHYPPRQLSLSQRFHLPLLHLHLHGLLESQVSLTNLLTLLEHDNLRCVNPFRGCLLRLLSNASDEESGVSLISDAILHFIGPVAYGLKLPRLVLQTGCVSFFSGFCCFQISAGKELHPCSRFPVGRANSRVTSPQSERHSGDQRE